jgi:chromosome segregation ATPase
MKLVSSQFDKNDKSVQALSARNNVLNKEIEAQKQKIDTLRSALQNASDSFGETDRRTQSWQIQLNNAEAALNGMERELSDNNAALESEPTTAKSRGRLEDMSAEMDDVTDNAVSAYADYEQLVGGVDTLFKDSSQKLQQYAANAYKTAGMSAKRLHGNRHRLFRKPYSIPGRRHGKSR